MRWLLALVFCCVVSTGCTLLLRPGDRDAGADAGGDDADQDGFDSDVDVPDADADRPADADSDGDIDADEGGTSPTVVDIAATTLSPQATYPAGSSVLVELTPTWDGDPTGAEELISIRATSGGLVSLPGNVAYRDCLSLRAGAAGVGTQIRLTFPLEPWPRTVALEWGHDCSDTQAVSGMSEHEVSAPAMREVAVGGWPDHTISLPIGVAAELYSELGLAFDYDTAGDYIRTVSLTFSWEGSASEMVVSTTAETCFFSPAGAYECCPTRPEEALATAGPDSVREVAFFPADDESRGLYLVAHTLDGYWYSGLYRLDRSCATEQLAPGVHGLSLDVVPGDPLFSPDHGTGIYWFSGGRLRFRDPRDSEGVAVCEALRLYPDSVAVADPATHDSSYLYVGDHSTAEVRGWVERYRATCGGNEAADVEGNDVVRLERATGTVFGRMIYALRYNDILLVVPQADGSTTLEPLIHQSWSDRFTHLAALPVLEGADHHPPGLYLLVGDRRNAVVVRLFQELE